MVKEFDKVVFNEAIGQVHGPVKTQFGYHLLEITSRTDGHLECVAARSPKSAPHVTVPAENFARQSLHGAHHDTRTSGVPAWHGQSVRGMLAAPVYDHSATSGDRT